MSLFDIEFGNWGSIVFTAAIALFVLLWFAGATTLGLLAGAILLILLAATVYYLGVRIDNFLRHGGVR